jgi:hypothetical protein
METHENQIQEIVKELQKKIAQEIYKALRPYSNVTNISFSIDYDYAHKTCFGTTVKTNEEWSNNIVQHKCNTIYDTNEKFGGIDTPRENDE